MSSLRLLESLKNNQIPGEGTSSWRDNIEEAKISEWKSVVTNFTRNKRANPNFAKDGLSLLHHAAGHQNHGAIEALLAESADPWVTRSDKDLCDFYPSLKPVLRDPEEFEDEAEYDATIRTVQILEESMKKTRQLPHDLYLLVKEDKLDEIRKHLNLNLKSGASEPPIKSGGTNSSLETSQITLTGKYYTNSICKYIFSRRVSSSLMLLQPNPNPPS